KLRLVKLGVVLRFPQGILRVLGPAHEVGDRRRRPVAVKHLQPEAKPGELALDLAEGMGRFPGEDALGRVVSVHGPAHEVVAGVVADVQHETGDERSDVDEAVGKASGEHLRRGGGKRQSSYNQDGTNPDPHMDHGDVFLSRFHTRNFRIQNSRTCIVTPSAMSSPGLTEMNRVNRKPAAAYNSR